MIAMNPRLVVLIVCAALLPAVQTRAKTILPDACGDDSVKFEVTTQKDQPAPGAPEAGKALLVLIETVEKPPACLGCGDFITRFGMDGAWVGANRANTYFAFSVTAGEHHLCVAGKGKDEVDVASFTAEPGKTYYYEVKRTLVIHHGDGPGRPYTGSDKTFNLSLLTEDKGKYRVKASELANWKTK